MCQLSKKGEGEIMPLLLRIEMIAVAIVFMIIVVKAVNRKKLWLQYSILWIIIAVGMMFLAFFPGVVEWAANLVGIVTPSNFIYLLALIALLILTFSLTVIISKQSQRIKTIIQIVSIEKYLGGEHDDNENPASADESCR